MATTTMTKAPNVTVAPAPSNGKNAPLAPLPHAIGIDAASCYNHPVTIRMHPQASWSEGDFSVTDASTGRPLLRVEGRVGSAHDRRDIFNPLAGSGQRGSADGLLLSIMKKNFTVQKKLWMEDAAGNAFVTVEKRGWSPNKARLEVCFGNRAAATEKHGVQGVKLVIVDDWRHHSWIEWEGRVIAQSKTSFDWKKGLLTMKSDLLVDVAPGFDVILCASLLVALDMTRERSTPAAVTS